MGKGYVPIFYDWPEVTEALDSEEKGRLIDAIVLYARGDDWREKVNGNERFIFPAFKQQIDRSAEISGVRARVGAIRHEQMPAKDGKPEQIQENASKHEQTTAKSANAEAKQSGKRFTAPTVEEVRAYCKERGNRVDAERFVDFYASKGWRVGNQPMKDWKAAVRTWEQRDDSRGTVGKTKTVAAQQYSQRDYSDKQQEMLDLQYAMMEAEMVAK